VINQYQAVESHSQNGIGITVVANFAAFLEMAHFEFAWRGQANNGHKATGEEPLNSADIL
jgi:hypothetical protein